MNDSILKIEHCGVSFGGLKALSNFSLKLSQGELVAIIGPNGAGKTTLFNLLTGVYRPSSGNLFFEGQSLKNLKPFQINRLGIARTFQNIRLFADLTVEENVMLGFHHRIQSSLWAHAGKMKKARQEEAHWRDAAKEILDLFSISRFAGELAKNLSYGDQRRLEMARALATGPKLFLLDEPAAGMNASEKKQLLEMIRTAREKFHLSVILIEHDMDVVMTLCPRIVVLDYGEVIAEGTPEEIRRNPRVLEAYLGTSPVV